jgi:hypothetical protein
MNEGRSAPVMRSSFLTEHGRSALIEVVATAHYNSAQTNNDGRDLQHQPIVRGSNGREDGEDTWSGWSIWGGVVSLFGAAN